VSGNIGSGDGDQDDPPPKQQQHGIQPCNPEPRHCKRCGAVLGPGTVATRFGDQPAYEVYVCAACGFIGWVAVSWGWSKTLQR
jgi:predicted RNA-binding Zn-ribbon protein involved in translation (DUF1610 family)